MSDATAKAERSKAKDLRQMQIPDGAVSACRTRKKKPFVVKRKWVNPLPYPFYFGWHTMGRYRKKSDAQKAMRAQESKEPGEFKMKLITRGKTI